MKVLALLLSLSLLIITHEFGHLGFAKLFHTRVRRFYLFFNPKFSLFKAKKFDGKWHFRFFSSQDPEEWDEKNLRPEDQDNTLWGIGWIPLGGYCDIAGMIDETKKADDLEKEPQPWEYRSRPAWQRLCIISGGVLVNFISALLIYTCIFSHWGDYDLPLRNATSGYGYSQIMLDEGFENGDIIYAIDGKDVYDLADAQQKLLFNKPAEVTVLRGDSLVVLPLSNTLLERINADPKAGLITDVYLPFQIAEFAPNSIAKEVGFEVGDRVLAINDQYYNVREQLREELIAHAGDSVQFTIVRAGDTCMIDMQLPDNGLLGVTLESHLVNLFEVTHHEYTFLQAIPAGIKYGCKTLATYVTSLKALFAKNGAQNLGGFITMGSIFPETWNWHSFWDITALLAIILAFMNVIPIPGLDGGHILFTLWEMITRRKPSDKFLEVAQTIGMILLIGLLVLANGNDIIRLFR